MENNLRPWLRLVEEDVTPDFYLHVSSGANLRSIMRYGLRQQASNYTGYEAALPGIYVTKEANLIRDHIFARGIEHDYILLLIRVASPSVIDEDAIDGWLQKALDRVAAYHDRAVDQLIEEMEPSAIAQAMVPPFRAALGPSHQVADDLAEFLAEFCEAWLLDRIIGEDSGADDQWWIAAKERVLRTFPRVSHAHYGASYSRRLPSPIGFSGATRIVTIIRVLDGVPSLVNGAIPIQVRPLVQSVA